MPDSEEKEALRVLSIVPYNIFPSKTGGQKGISLFNEYFAQEVELHCASVDSNLQRYAKGYTMHSVLSSSAFRYINPLVFFRMRKLIRTYKISHLILEHTYFGWLGVLLKWFCGVKLVIHSHNIESTRWKSLGKWWWRVLWAYEGWTHRRANYNFFIHDNDREYAINAYKLNPVKCTTVTYGIEWNQQPTNSDKVSCRQQLCEKHGLNSNTKIFIFNGALDYYPNQQALSAILEIINPQLLSKPGNNFQYRILICGRGLPQKFNELKEYTLKNIVYAGFVDDISVYFKGADVFINPVVDGGGIKTKLVEAIGSDTPAISTLNGSIGIGEEAGRMLSIVHDADWDNFVKAMINITSLGAGSTPATFYEKFYWGNIVKRAVNFIR